MTEKMLTGTLRIKTTTKLIRMIVKLESTQVHKVLHNKAQNKYKIPAVGATIKNESSTTEPPL